MRRAWVIVASCGFVAACAQILGIDDGIPRTSDDASVLDASTPETTTLPDATPPPVDAPPDVPTSPLACGTNTCNALVQGCCRTGDPVDAAAQSFACVTDAAACTGGLVVTCDNATTCAALGHPGDVCCANVPDGGAYATKTTCVAAAACTAAGGAILCTPGDDEVCDVDAGQSCLPSVQTIVGWDLCKT